MAETFLKTVNILKPLAPAYSIRGDDQGTNTNDSTAAYELVDSTATFTGLVLEGMIAINHTDGKSARILEVIDADELLLDEDIFQATAKSYEIVWPARDVIAPGGDQEILTFRIWARNKIDGGTDTKKIYLYKEGFDLYATYPIAETKGGTGATDTILVRDRLFPTAEKYYVIENACPTTTHYTVEGLDKTIGSLSQDEGDSSSATGNE